MAPYRKDNRCYRGHLVEGPNAKVLPNGKVACRECRRQAVKDSYQNRKARERAEAERSQELRQ